MTITVPINPATDAGGKVRAITDRTVHVVDDDEAVRDSLSVLLESYGMAVRAHGSADEFLKQYREIEPACLVLDIHMPGINGLELLEILRRRGARIPVVVLTGRADMALRERLERANVVAVLDKPAGEAALVNAITQAFARNAAAT